MPRKAKEKTTANQYMNYWLKWHNTTIEEAMAAHPEWKEDSMEFYRAFRVTEEQHDEWYEWAIKTVMKEYRLGRRRAEREFCLPYLNLAPMIKT